MHALNTDQEQALLAAYKLDPEANGIAPRDIAELTHMDSTDTAYSIRTLAALGLLTQNGRQTVYLTVSGRNMASTLQDQRDTIRSFLIDSLGIDPEDADRATVAVQHALGMAG